MHVHPAMPFVMPSPRPLDGAAKPGGWLSPAPGVWWRESKRQAVRYCSDCGKALPQGRTTDDCPACEALLFEDHGAWLHLQGLA